MLKRLTIVTPEGETISTMDDQSEIVIPDDAISAILTPVDQYGNPVGESTEMVPPASPEESDDDDDADEESEEVDPDMEFE